MGAAPAHPDSVATTSITLAAVFFLMQMSPALFAKLATFRASPIICPLLLFHPGFSSFGAQG